MFFVSYDPRFEARPVHMVQLNREDIADELEAFKGGLLKFIDKLNEYESQILDTF